MIGSNKPTEVLLRYCSIAFLITFLANKAKLSLSFKGFERLKEMPQPKQPKKHEHMFNFFYIKCLKIHCYGNVYI
jgi:hypothetical protein